MTLGCRAVSLRADFFYRATLCQRSIIAVVVGLSVSPSLSVCQSVTSRYCIETSGRIELILAWRLPSTCFTLHCKERWLSPNTRALPSGALSQGLRKFRHGKSIALSKTRPSSSPTVELVDDTNTTIESRRCLLYN